MGHVVSRRFILAAGGALVAASAQAQTARPKVKIGLLRSLYDVGIGLADSRSYFAAEGIDVELYPFSDTAEGSQALAVGAIDAVTQGISGGLLNLMARGVEAKIVASAGEHAPGHGVIGLVIRRELVDSGRFKGPADLKGLKLALGQNAPPHWLVKKYGDAAGIGRRDVELVSTGIGNVLPAMINKAIDGACLLEPYASELIRRTDAVRVVSMDQVQPNFPAGYLMFGPSLVTRNHDAGERLLRGYLRGVKDYRDAFDRSGDKEAVVRDLRSRQVNVATDMVSVGFPEDMAPSTAHVDAFIAWQMEVGVLKTKPDISSFIANDQRAAALQAVGGRI
ncbi:MULTISPECIES: ABC transporter substrate-binding protein [unclassified Beijerinckia]|uniref:ABC transporter substrate-binding protein n=1 Tax=unclassified Beijerinckia TaxID=2638183 RepID=UPI000894A74C|nr:MULTISPECIES: ABC transporter substrate-binding protein [unclassified Beijerinckia]MDH7799055.1 NitT/TauT family transport system substrate-binding protein [Beijerinckia sp. GAS462]SED96552.1 NitT/TauT family transport system substrate-binding protein [Beijerinckia sp. 28-YEA-48]